MPRSEFSPKTKRQARDRSGGTCEATGMRYGLGEGVRCTRPVAEYDHDKTDKECRDLGIKSNTLENCVALCRSCHHWKTVVDVRRIRKADRQRDKSTGVKQSRNSMPGSRRSKWRKRMDGGVERR